MLLKSNPIGVLTQAIGAIDYTNNPARRTARAINGNPMGGFEYFCRSMVGLSGDDLISTVNDYSRASDYWQLSGTKEELKYLNDFHKGDKPLTFDEYMKKVGYNSSVASVNDYKRAYNQYVNHYQENKNKIPELEQEVTNLQESIKKSGGNIENAKTSLMKKLKDYGYTKQMEENGISPLFFINNLADGNLVEWSTNQSSVLNETNRKNLAESLSEMILVPGSENVNLYEYDENKGAMDQLTNKEYKQISGYDPTNNKAGQTPLITHDPRHRDLLICKYTDEDGIQHSYALKTADLHKHPGFDRMVRKALNEDADAYLDYTNPNRFFNMPIAKQDKYLKNLYKGMNEEQKATANRAMCAQWVMKCNPGLTDINAINKEVEDMYANRPQEVYSIILKNAIKSEVNSRNHDMINSSVKDLLWGLGESNTTPEQKSLWFKYYGVGLD